MADPKGPGDKGQEKTEEREPRLISHFKVNENLIGRSIVYGAAPPPKRRRVRRRHRLAKPRDR